MGNGVTYIATADPLLRYGALGFAPIFFNALKGARTYLRQKAAPWRLGKDMWFTGDMENRDRVRL